mmetsp:Transcript_18309/g.17433  ORF Transcript_18309/g.17433 Transcript_18309/m.17433 type:complete len:103 (+) Transcript_18309:1688-1996(+)
MTKIGYIGSFDSHEKEMLNSIWNNLIPESGGNGNELGISQKNLITFLCCLENIFLPSMVAYPYQEKLRRQHGFLVQDQFYIEDEGEVKKIHNAFLILYTNKL